MGWRRVRHRHRNTWSITTLVGLFPSMTPGRARLPPKAAGSRSAACALSNGLGNCSGIKPTSYARAEAFHSWPWLVRRWAMGAANTTNDGKQSRVFGLDVVAS